MKLNSAITIFLLSLLLSSHTWAAATHNVVVTIKPLHSLVSGVMGNTGSAQLLLEGNSSPHDFHLKPSQVKAMQGAEVIFYIGDGFETFLLDAFETLPAHVRKMAVVEKSKLNMLEYRQGGAWDAHAHAHEGHGHDDHHGHDHGVDHHDAANYDMHVWLDPKNARRIVKAIAKKLGEIYPENRKIYKANARALRTQIKALDAQLRASLKGVQDKPFIVFHDAYQYFERAYRLNAVGSITFEPDESPSPNRIKQVRKKLQQTGATCVFREPQFSDRLIATVTEGTTAKSGMLDPLGADLPSGETLYFSLMNDLANSLKQCLQ